MRKWIDIMFCNERILSRIFERKQKRKTTWKKSIRKWSENSSPKRLKEIEENYFWSLFRRFSISIQFYSIWFFKSNSIFFQFKKKGLVLFENLINRFTRMNDIKILKLFFFLNCLFVELNNKKKKTILSSKQKSLKMSFIPNWIVSETTDNRPPPKKSCGSFFSFVFFLGFAKKFHRTLTSRFVRDSSIICLI